MATWFEIFTHLHNQKLSKLLAGFLLGLEIVKQNYDFLLLLKYQFNNADFPVVKKNNANKKIVCASTIESAISLCFKCKLIKGKGKSAL